MKINIRESLLKLDQKTDCKYDLLSMYESCTLDEKKKEELVKYIASCEHPDKIGQFLETNGGFMMEAVEDDISENDMVKLVDEINNAEAPTFWEMMEEANDKESKITESVMPDGSDCDAKAARSYVWERIKDDDKLTDDDSRYWDFDRGVYEGDCAKVVNSAPKNAKYLFSLMNSTVDIDMYLGRCDSGDCWYIVDNKATVAESVESSLTEDYDVVAMNDEYFPRLDITDTDRYDYVQYKGKDFAYDKKDNVLHFLFKDEEEIEAVGGIEACPFRSLDAAGLSADSWNDPEMRDEYLSEYASDIEDEASYMVQDFIQNELPFYQKNEAVATAEKPLSSLGGTLSSVLLSHKDEVDKLFTAKDAIEFLDRIRPEVKNVGYVDKVKADIMRKRGIMPVQYFYNIILKGDGEGTDKGGVVSKKSQIRKWAAQPAMEAVEEDDDKPYTYKQVFDELKSETKNFTVKDGAGKYGYESEANHAVKILEKHYASVELDRVGSWFQVEFKGLL